jgi:hypothetical protein
VQGCKQTNASREPSDHFLGTVVSKTVKQKERSRTPHGDAFQLVIPADLVPC